MKTPSMDDIKKKEQRDDEPKHLAKADDYIVTVAVWEARQLAGLEIDPFVEVTVGDKGKKTKTKKGTNDPTFEETFIFEFLVPPAVFLDQLIILEVWQSGGIFGRNKVIGTFKTDLATVYDQPEHMFFHRWALLIDSNKPLSGPKGYLCCDVIISKKGQAIKAPNIDDIDDDIDANLMLPDEVASSILERQPARYVLGVHGGEGLPNLRSAAFASVKKAITGKPPIDLIDPFVQVSFAGQRGRTRVKNDTSNPSWCQQIIFTELFPPLVRSMRLHVRDDSGAVVATTFLDLRHISDNSDDGYMPTFGPAHLNLYGALRGANEVSPLNFGMGEGLAYRGRILVSLRVEIEENISKKGLRNVQIKNCLPLPEMVAGPKEEFFLFCCILDADMIDKRLSGKNLSFELSIGNDGMSSDLQQKADMDKLKKPSDDPTRQSAGDLTAAVDPHAAQIIEEFPKEGPRWYSRTVPLKPTARDEYFCYIPFGSRKPCLSIYTTSEDQRQRMYNVNVLKRLSKSYEVLLTDVVRLMEMEQMKDAVRRLKMGLERLSSACNEFMAYVSSTSMDSPFETPLDRHKKRQREREMAKILAEVPKVRGTIRRENIMAKIQESYAFLDRLRLLSIEAQESQPDVFLWLISANRRLAYTRFRSEDLLYSMNDEERGQFCAKPHTFFLKLPGKAEVPGENWEIWGQVTAYFWFGLSREMETYMEGIPKKFSQSVKNRAPASPDYVPPVWINYKEAHAYELRCHVYQGRALTPTDESGLSDPFIRVLFVGHSMQTHIVDQTVNPLWDQTLICPAVKIYGVPTDMQRMPPKIVCQVYDQDLDGSCEFIGQIETYPVLKLANEKYVRPRFPPVLQWMPVYKGSHRVGEVLACFELLQLEKQMRGYPPLPPTSPTTGRMHVPEGIRPQLCPFRIEMLFWGLRDLKSPGVMTVDKPRVEVEVCGSVLKSVALAGYKRCQNFGQDDLVRSMEVLLPTDPLFQPPMTIRVVDGRAFGRSVLVGTHVVSNIDAFVVDSNADECAADDAGAVVVEMEPSDGTLIADDEQTLLMDDGSEAPTLAIDESVAERPPSVDDDGYFVRPAGDVERTDESDASDDDEPPFPQLPFPPPAVDESADGSAEHLSAVRSVDDNRSVRSVGTGKSKFANGSIRSFATFAASGSKPQAQLDTLEEVDVDEKAETPAVDDSDLGSRRPLPPDKPPAEDADKAKAKKKDEPEVILDWWCKYYASTQDKEDIRRMMRVKRSRKKLQAFNMLTKKAVNKVWDTASDLKAKLHTKKGKGGKDDFLPVARRGPSTDVDKSLIERLTIYDVELELQPEFEGFRDTLQAFRLYRGKKTFHVLDERNRYVGCFKGNMRISRVTGRAVSALAITEELPVPLSNEAHFFTALPSSVPVKVLIRLYVIKASNLKPQDANGKADPYLLVQLGKQKRNDKAHRVNVSLNPIFGRMFEFEGSFPPDTELLIQVWDYDRVSSNDLMGETRVDLEQRYYSCHRALCGLPTKYETKGYNAWPDVSKPSQILQALCDQHSLRGPYYKRGQVNVGGKRFCPPRQKSEPHIDSENVALWALNHWADMPDVGCLLVPEHVENRSLYLPETPGIEQGTLDMFVSIFPKEGLAVPPPIDITPRKPKTYELRVTIWDTKDVPLDDYNPVTGSSVDQYIKGYIIAPEADGQQTDVHYRSLNGEGNFNWRFVYRFQYLDAEEKITYKKKETWYSLSEYEEKIPPKLTLEVWDADTFSGDDYIGVLLVDLTKVPRGARTHGGCSLKLLDTDGNNLRCNIFRQKRLRGWWPFVQVDQSGEPKLAGKVDIEFNLMSDEEAEQRPCGLGRDAPEPIPEPIRPETSFAFWMSPLKFLKFGIWDGLKYKCIVFLIVILLLAFLAAFIYTLPEAVADNIITGLFGKSTG